ncbi:MAG: fibronectin type III domain-containing protein [Patescibacteria group bacterium]|jgi:hypothetical protein
MWKIFLKVTIFLTIYLLLTNSVSAEVYTRFVTSGTFGSQTNEDTLSKCDNSTSSSYNSAFYDYFTVDNTDLPPVDELVSIDYCIQGRGDLNVGFNTEHFSTFVGDNSEQCYKASIYDYPNIYENIWQHNGYGLFAGALNSDSSTDCLYIKINTITPSPTNTPTPSPTNTPTPTSTLTPTPFPTTTSTNTPTLILTATNTPTHESSLTTETTNIVSTPICNDQKPGSAPVLHLATSSGPNSITLNWEKANEPVSYYLVAYGMKPGEQLYGNPNVGNSDTTSYTISNLSSGQNYYFKVRAGNGCTPGDFSNEVIGRVFNGPIAGIPEGFVEDVLGVSIKTSPQPPTIKKTKTNQTVKKIEKKFPKYIFPIILLILFVATSIYVYKKKDSSF